MSAHRTNPSLDARAVLSFERPRAVFKGQTVKSRKLHHIAKTDIRSSAKDFVRRFDLKVRILG